MNKFEITQDNDFYDLTEMLRKAEDSEVVFEFKNKSNIYRNSTNLKVIQSMAEDLQKQVTFEVEDEAHKDYIEAVNNDTLKFDDSQVDLNATDENETYVSDVAKVGFIAGIKQKFANDKKYDESIGKKKRSFSIKWLLIALVFFGLLVGGIWALLWYLPSATVRIQLNSEVLVKLLNIKAVSGQPEISVEGAMIPAYTLEVTETDSQSNPTTGEKEIGEKAKGKIILTNKTDDDIKLDKGTEVKLISSDSESLKYVTVKDVEIDAQSEETTTEADTTTGTTAVTTIVYGKEEIDIEAVEFGEDYNQDSGEKFEIDDYDTDELIGENESDIDGGSKETVQVVTEEDMITLEKELTEFMEKKVYSGLQRKTVQGQILLESSIQYTIDSQEFDKELDEEADNLTLEMTMTGTGLAYSEDDLDELVTLMIIDIIPAEYQLDEADPEYEVAIVGISEDGTTLDMQIKLRSYITPTLAEEKIKNDIAGMSISSAEQYLNNLPNVSGYEIKLSPRMPEFLRKIPRNVNNIRIIIEK